MIKIISIDRSRHIRALSGNKLIFIFFFVFDLTSQISQYVTDDLTSRNQSGRDDLARLHADIRSLFATKKSQLREICDYYFDGSGKSIRPKIICHLAGALNKHYDVETNAELYERQRRVALIAEMIHVASLIHDDIIDNSELRRGKASVQTRWGPQKAVLAGDYIMGVASSELSRLANVDVIQAMSNILEDLVKGELMQLGTKEAESERFQHYSLKTYRKTASLIANSCKSVAHLIVETKVVDAKESESLVNKTFEFGKNVGIAFQLIDDVLDFTSHSDQLGKPGCGADLRLGLATAPVLFAASQYSELNSMILRRFSQEGDVQKAFEFVLKSDGIKETKLLASKYCENAMATLDTFNSGPDINNLRLIIKTVMLRNK